MPRSSNTVEVAHLLCVWSRSATPSCGRTHTARLHLQHQGLRDADAASADARGFRRVKSMLPATSERRPRLRHRRVKFLEWHLGCSGARLGPASHCRQTRPSAVPVSAVLTARSSTSTIIAGQGRMPCGDRDRVRHNSCSTGARGPRRPFSIATGSPSSRSTRAGTVDRYSRSPARRLTCAFHGAPRELVQA